MRRKTDDEVIMEYLGDKLDYVPEQTVLDYILSKKYQILFYVALFLLGVSILSQVK